MDMVRDIKCRITEFFLGHLNHPNDIAGVLRDKDWMETESKNHLLHTHAIDFDVIHVALTRAQINQYNPPPNPAKRTDPRSRKFISEHGSTSWEVDALPPQVLNSILTTAIKKNLNGKMYDKILAQEKVMVKKLKQLSAHL
jgi:hypothetical protein